MAAHQTSAVTRSNPNLPEMNEADQVTNGDVTGFVCYIQMDAATHDDRPSSDSILSGPRFRQTMASADSYYDHEHPLRPEHLSTRTECFQNASNNIREGCRSMSESVYGKIAEDDEYVCSSVSKMRSYSDTCTPEGTSQSCDSKCPRVQGLGDDDVYSDVNNIYKENTPVDYESTQLNIRGNASMANDSTNIHDLETVNITQPASHADQNIKYNIAVHSDETANALTDHSDFMNRRVDMFDKDWLRSLAGRESTHCVYSTLIHSDQLSSFESDISDLLLRKSNCVPSKCPNGNNEKSTNNHEISSKNRELANECQSNNNVSTNALGIDFEPSDGLSISADDVIYATVRRPKSRFYKGRCCEICRSVIEQNNTQV